MTRKGWTARSGVSALREVIGALDMPSRRLLIVDDDPEIATLLSEVLPDHGYLPSFRQSLAAAATCVREENFDAILIDVHFPEGNGLDLLRICRGITERIPVVMMTSRGDVQGTIEALREGADDFILKPIEVEYLVHSLGRAIERRELRREVEELRERNRAPDRRWDSLIGDSPPIRRLMALMDKVKDKDTSLLIQGETGTGKEVVARALHEAGHRARGPFVAVNCAAMPESLLESELFGSIEGAFTGANQSRSGLLRQSDGGTLFLDEIGDMPLSLQSRLLRALQERKVRPLGGDHEVPFDTRLVAATNRDLEALVEEGSFREDLLFRIQVITLDLPPLRERGNDVLAIAQHFLNYFSRKLQRNVTGITPAAAHRMLEYPWPGNVRELRNIIERGVSLTEHSLLGLEDLPDRLRTFRRTEILVPWDPGGLLPLSEVEKRYILRVLESCGGHRGRTGDILGIDRKTLYRKLRSYGEEG